MNLTGNQKLLILGIVVVVILYLVYMQKEGAETVSAKSETKPEIKPVTKSEPKLVATKSTAETETRSVDTSLSTVTLKEDKSLPKSESDKLLLQKMKSKNSATDGQYKRVNYADGNRLGSTKNLDDFFEQGNPLNESDNSKFLPNDIGANQASYSGSPRKELSDDEKFNASALLPKEEKKDWFEDVTPQKIKNRHLINIYRPIGVNTVITSRKNGSLDLRGNPVNPKTFVSPFLNSSIEPDVNARGICT
jgi:hypothetical protein